MTTPSQTSAAAIRQEPVRDLDPNVSQRNASQPSYSVWVAASAGTGKTKVLTDRVLRLLLPRDDGQGGTLPHQILCLTFTKAAASEMAIRINETLGKWAVLEEEALREKLEALLGKAPLDAQMEKARQLFAQVVDTPGGLKIMTIHSFCQSVLGRFPLEAGLPPYFEMMDETQATALMKDAQKSVLKQARAEPDSDTGQALHVIATIQNENQFMELLSAISRERTQLKNWLNENDTGGLYTLFGLSRQDSADNVLDRFFAAMPRNDLYETVRVMSEGSKTDQERALGIKNALEFNGSDFRQAFEDYAGQFLTTKDEPRAKLVTNGVLKNAPHTGDILAQECARVLEIKDTLKALDCIFYTQQLLTLGAAILDRYEAAKRRQAVLDYDDLILKTRDLLKKGTDWVMYKLDGGLSHILVDEAQDTNPEQWEIIDLLAGEFFSGQAASASTRTLFTVGDEKQSIYSFQRAAPEEFARMQKHFEEKVKNADALWRDEALNISFRSTKTVLDLVDRTFADVSIRRGLGQMPLEHKSYRRGQAGLAELWPVFETIKPEPEPPWSPPVTIREQKSGASQLADYIGQTVKNWIDNGENLESCDRAIKAGDIMILVRTRTAFVNQIMRALKTRNVPVSGADRMVLGDQIAVMDMKAALQFALLPEDDLTLACLLKSPLIGMDEDTLYNLAIDRKGTLWAALQKSAHTDIRDYLYGLIETAKGSSPYGFMSALLHTACPADEKGGLRAITKRLGRDAHDPLDELLNTALEYEQDGVMSLQAFLGALDKNDVTIKREMEEAGNAVRIMTVHGAKGLQAPIVILPDSFTTATAVSNKLPRLLWPDKSSLPAPLFMPSADNTIAPALYRDARANVAEKMDEEYRRLLYVAMTRAEDRLYVCGHTGGQSPREDSWYSYIEKAFTAHDDCDEFAFETPDSESKNGLRLYHPQTAEPDRKGKGTKSDSPQQEAVTLPTWMYKQAPEEPDPPRPLIPSRPSESDPASASPLSKDDSYRFKRGNITHMLLQLLPDLPVENRKRAAERYLAKPSLDLPDNVRESILKETFAILDHAEFAPLFGEGSIAEVPLTGLIDGKLVSAQIDRLLITDNEIMIVDYKTNRPPPANPEDIPQIYTKQMLSYRDIVTKIYGHHNIRCYLLWTDGPYMMEVPL